MQQEVYAVFNLGPWEIILILLVVLLLFGAKRLPSLAKGLGQGIREFKGALDGAKKEIEEAGDAVTDKTDEDKSA
jgi:sec-independent protein translocase protein TatA